MTQDQTLLFALFAAVFGLLLWGRWRYDLIAFSALLAAVLMGLVPADRAFEGFGHPAVVIVAMVLVVSAGLTRSGVVHLITRTMIDPRRPLPLHVATMGAVGAVLSAFMNNVAALALLMPVDIQAARKAGRPPGLTLMPLAFATILGGMVTLIGTPPNIIIATIREQSLGAPFGMFDFAPAGGAAALAGLAFVALVGWRLIPAREDGLKGGAALRPYLAELVVPADSPAAGRTLAEIEDDAEKADVAILGLLRQGRRRPERARHERLRAGDSILVEATPEALDEFRTALGLAFAPERDEARLQAEGEGVTLVEAVVPENSRLAGRTARAVGLAWRRHTLLLGIAREGRTLTSRVRQTPIRPGDVLLLLVPSDAVDEVADWLGVLPLEGRGLSVVDTSKTALAIGLFGAAVVAASLGVVSLAVALGLVVVAFVLFSVLPLREIYDHVEWPVVVLLGSMIPLGQALEASGGTTLIAGRLVALAGGLPSWAVLTLLMVVTMSLSDVLNNTATTIVAAPVAIEMAQGLGASPDPFLMAVAVAASSAFLTPIGHKNNTLILGPGGYRFGDYWRMGLPLEIVVIAVSVPVILVVWPL